MNKKLIIALCFSASIAQAGLMGRLRSGLRGSFTGSALSILLKRNLGGITRAFTSDSSDGTTIVVKGGIYASGSTLKGVSVNSHGTDDDGSVIIINGVRYGGPVVTKDSTVEGVTINGNSVTVESFGKNDSSTSDQLSTQEFLDAVCET